MIGKENFLVHLERLARCFGYRLTTEKTEALYDRLGHCYTDSQWETSVSQLCCDARWPQLHQILDACEGAKEAERRARIKAEHDQALAVMTGERYETPHDDWWLLHALRAYWNDPQATLKECLIAGYQQAHIEQATEPGDYERLNDCLTRHEVTKVALNIMSLPTQHEPFKPVLNFSSTGVAARCSACHEASVVFVAWCQQEYCQSCAKAHMPQCAQCRQFCFLR